MTCRSIPKLGAIGCSRQRQNDLVPATSGGFGCGMALLALKLILTPALIVAVSLAARRWGPKNGGLAAGLPLTSAPVSAFLVAEQGADFAAKAAVGTVAGVASVGAFCFTYSLLAKRWGWVVCTSVSILCFLLVSGILRLVALDLIASALVTAGVLSAVLAFFPRAVTRRVVTQRPPWDLPGRAVAATALVLLLTGAAPILGAHLSGLISPFPVFANVLAAFSHAHDGPGASTLLLKGIVLASFAFESFFLVVGWGLVHWGIGLTYAIATLVAMAVSWMTYHLEYAA